MVEEPLLWFTSWLESLHKGNIDKSLCFPESITKGLIGICGTNVSETNKVFEITFNINYTDPSLSDALLPLETHQ